MRRGREHCRGSSAWSGVLRRAAFQGVAIAALSLSSQASAELVQCRDAHGVIVISPAGADSACRDASVTLVSRGTRGGSAAAAVASPASFPRVDAAVQRRRDDDRALILRSELESEQARLQQLETDLPKAPASASPGAIPDRRVTMADVEAQIARTRQNVLAIQREISGLK